MEITLTEKARTANSTFAIGGVSCSKDSFVGNQTLVFQIEFCGKSPALGVAANRTLGLPPSKFIPPKEISAIVRNLSNLLSPRPSDSFNGLKHNQFITNLYTGAACSYPSYSASTFVVKIATFAKPKIVMDN
jgi:hypothetical protein